MGKLFASEFLVGPIVAAALVDGTLIAYTLLLLWLVELSAGIARDVSPSGWFMLYATPCLAPWVYRILWRSCKFAKSPGEQWLALQLRTVQGPYIQSLLTDCLTGFAAFLLSLTSTWLADFVIVAAYGGGNTSKVPTFLTMSGVVIITYCYGLVLLLVISNLRKAKNQSAGGISVPPLSLRKVAPFWHCLVRLAGPFLLCVLSVSLTPNYYSVLLREPISWLIVLPLALWWCLAAIIFRYWSAPRADWFYAIVFVLPGILYFLNLPALAACLRIGPLKEIY